MHKMTIGAIIAQQIPTVSLIDLELIIAHVLHIDRTSVIAHPERSVLSNDAATITAYCEKRAHGYPLAYITGKKEFYGREFKVNNNTLIPRPETEMIFPLVDNILSTIHFNDSTILLDIGTGSGVIAITAALEYRRNIFSHIIATDISHAALQIAKENAIRYSADLDITFMISDLLSDRSIHQRIQSSQCDHVIICANLPYVDDTKKDFLLTRPASRSLRYEPEDALWSSDRGLAHYKRLLTHVEELKYECPELSITCLLEISPEQKDIINNIFRDKKMMRSVLFFDDLSHRTRYVQYIA